MVNYKFKDAQSVKQANENAMQDIIDGSQSMVSSMRPNQGQKLSVNTQ